MSPAHTLFSTGFSCVLIWLRTYSLHLLWVPTWVYPSGFRLFSACCLLFLPHLPNGQFQRVCCKEKIRHIKNFYERHSVSEIRMISMFDNGQEALPHVKDYQFIYLFLSTIVNTCCISFHGKISLQRLIHYTWMWSRNSLNTNIMTQLMISHSCNAICYILRKHSSFEKFKKAFNLNICRLMKNT